MARPWQLAALCLGLCAAGAAAQTSTGPVQFYNTSDTLLPVSLGSPGKPAPAWELLPHPAQASD